MADTVYTTFHEYNPPSKTDILEGVGDIKIIDHGIWELCDRPDLSESVNGLPPLVPAGTIFSRRVSDQVDWYEYSKRPGIFPSGSIICCVMLTNRGWKIDGVWVDKRLVFPGIQRVIEIRNHNGPIKGIHNVYTGLCYGPKSNTLCEFENNKDDLIKYLSSAKSKIEEGGIFVNNYAVATDRGSQAMITQTVVGLGIFPDMKIAWKGPDGKSTMLSGDFIKAMAKCTLMHVSKCFAVYAEARTKVENGSLSTTADIDAFYKDRISPVYNIPY